MVTPSSFKIRFPEFDSIGDSRVQLFIDDAILILNESFWGVKYDLGVNYYTAHRLALQSINEDNNAGGDFGKDDIGPVSSKAVDGTSVSYASPSLDNTSDAYFAQTSYGQEYMNLRKNLGIAAYVI